MSTITSYAPGTFCWVELSTTDPIGARRFYTELFGWTTNDIPMGEQGTYFMFQKKDADTGAMYEQMAEEKQQGVPPHWNSYISVASADRAAEKAKSLGAQVVAGPFDVFDSGRMAFIMDPQGAMFAVWEAKKHIGATVKNEAGALCWNELYTPDIEKSREFYSAMFDWKLKISPEYTEAHVGEEATAGMMQIDERLKGMPPHWMPYFAVDDADATVEKVKANGGRVHHGPMDIPNVGRFAVVADPQGAGFAIIKLTM